MVATNLVSWLQWNKSVYVNNHKFHGPYLHYQLNNKMKPVHQDAQDRKRNFQRSCSYSEEQSISSSLPQPAEEQGHISTSAGDYFQSHDRQSGTPVEPVKVTGVTTKVNMFAVVCAV